MNALDGVRKRNAHRDGIRTKPVQVDARLMACYSLS